MAAIEPEDVQRRTLGNPRGFHLMRIRNRLMAATAVAALGVAGPAAAAMTSSSASASTDLCVHLFIASASHGTILDIHIIVLPPISEGPGPCPR